MADRDDLFDEEPSPPEGTATATTPPPGPNRGVSRRRFIFGASAAAAAGVAVGAGGGAALIGRDDSGGSASSAPAKGGPASGQAADTVTLGAPADRAVGEAVVKLEVNGKNHWVSVQSHESLAEVLRERLGLTGTKVGCDRSECSACTVLIEGTPYNSCSLLAIREDGAKILTIEGLEQGGALSAVQQAFVDNMGLQCGFCTPGQIMQATALLARNPRPTEDDIRHEMSGNLCKCAAYENILASVQAAAKGRVG